MRCVAARLRQHSTLPAAVHAANASTCCAHLCSASRERRVDVTRVSPPRQRRVDVTRAPCRRHVLVSITRPVCRRHVLVSVRRAPCRRHALVSVRRAPCRRHVLVGVRRAVAAAAAVVAPTPMGVSSGDRGSSPPHILKSKKL